MRNYNYNKLLDSRTFEYFAKDVIEILENKRFEIFSQGRDYGIDLRNIENNFTTIVQVKNYKYFNSLYNELKNNELEKVKKLNPDRYIIITSVSISVDNKRKIKDLFGNYILNEKDIIGEEELNSLLEKQEFKFVEEEYYQLWINSTNTLTNIIKKELNAETFAYTKDELENIKESTKVYVQNETFKKAIRILKKKKCILICGEPGIGKTILARNICAYLINQNRNLEFIFDTKITNFPKLFQDDKPQLFFIDDFWGSKFDNRLNKEEKELKRIIEIVEKSENKILILTSREYILSQGYAEFPELEEFFDKYKLTLHVEDYSDLFKAKILFQHLKQSQLTSQNIYEISKGYKSIIRNENYSPRIIENYIEYVGSKEIEPENYLRDFMEYLDNPNKLWEEVFAKQSEGAQLITILMLAFEENVKLKDIKNVFCNYIDADSKTKARKKEFGKYISQLENTLITTYNDSTKDNEIYIKFKNSSIELFIYQYFIENIEEYAYNFINATTYFNNLMYLVGSWSMIDNHKKEALQYEHLEIEPEILKKLRRKVIEKIIKDFDELKFLRQEDLYKRYVESEEYCVYKTILCMDIYEKHRDQVFKEWINEKIEELLNKLEEDSMFDYKDLFDIPKLIQKSINLKINTQIDISKIIKSVYRKIRFSDQIPILLGFRAISKKEYNEFYEKNKQHIHSRIYNLVLEDASYFSSESDTEMIEQLIYCTVPEVFKIFGLKYTNEFMGNFYQKTGRRLIEDLTEEDFEDEFIFDYDDFEDEEINNKINQEELEEIENERVKLIDSLHENDLIKEDVQHFFEEKLKNNNLINDLISFFQDGENNYISCFMDNWEGLELLSEYINYLNEIPKNARIFFEGLLSYLQLNNKILSNLLLKDLKTLAYRTFKEGRNHIFKRELLEIVNEEELEELLESKIIYVLRNKYFFRTTQLHTYLGLITMLEEKESLESIYSNFCGIAFCNPFNDICNIYADIDIQKFNEEFLHIELTNLLDRAIHEEKILFLKEFDITIDLDLKEDDYNLAIGSSVTNGPDLLALEYIGFNIFDMICNPVEENLKEEISKLYEREVIVINEDIIDEKKFCLLEKLGIVRYIEKLCLHIEKCIKLIKNNPSVNLRDSFKI